MRTTIIKIKDKEEVIKWISIEIIVDKRKDIGRVNNSRNVNKIVFWHMRRSLSYCKSLVRNKNKDKNIYRDRDRSRRRGKSRNIDMKWG